MHILNYIFLACYGTHMNCMSLSDLITTCVEIRYVIKVSLWKIGVGSHLEHDDGNREVEMVELMKASNETYCILN